MKNKRTFKVLTFTLAAAALSGAIACAACSNDTYLPDDPPYDFENPVTILKIPSKSCRNTTGLLRSTESWMRAVTAISNGWRHNIPTPM